HGALHAEDVACPVAGVVGVEAGIVEGDGGGRHAVGDRVGSHGGGLVVAGGVVVTGHQQAVDLAHAVETDGRVQAIGQEPRRGAVAGEPGAQHQRHLVVGDVGRVGGEAPAGI